MCRGARKHIATGKLEKTRFGFNVKAVHIEKGVILWKATVFRNIDSLLGYTSPVQNLVNEVMAQLSADLKKKGL